MWEEEQRAAKESQSHSAIAADVTNIDIGMGVVQVTQPPKSQSDVASTAIALEYRD